jgi:hypothetical protein
MIGRQSSELLLEGRVVTHFVQVVEQEDEVYHFS